MFGYLQCRFVVNDKKLIFSIHHHNWGWDFKIAFSWIVVFYSVNFIKVSLVDDRLWDIQKLYHLCSDFDIPDHCIKCNSARCVGYRCEAVAANGLPGGPGPGQEPRGSVPNCRGFPQEGEGSHRQVNFKSQPLWFLINIFSYVRVKILPYRSASRAM